MYRSEILKSPTIDHVIKMVSVEQEINPHAAEWEKRESFPAHQVTKIYFFFLKISEERLIDLEVRVER